jgi:hypothetical protein
MDEWGWEQLGPWLAARVELPVGPLFCVIDGRTRGRPWAAAAVRSELRRVAARAGVRAPLRPAPAKARARTRTCPRGGAAQHHPAPSRAGESRHHIDLPAGDRPRGDHHRRAHSARADDVRQRWTQALTGATSGKAAGAPRGAPAPPWRSECTDTCGREHRSSSKGGAGGASARTPLSSARGGPSGASRLDVTCRASVGS